MGIALILPALVLADGTSYVAMTGGNTIPYDSWANAATNLHPAVDTALASDWTSVLISNGTYYLTNYISISKE